MRPFADGFDELFYESQHHYRFGIAGGALQAQQFRTESGTALRFLSGARSSLKTWTGEPGPNISGRFQLTAQDFCPPSAFMPAPQDLEDAFCIDAEHIRNLAQTMGNGLHTSGVIEAHGRFIGVTNFDGLWTRDIQKYKRLLLRIGSPATDAVDFLELITPDILGSWDPETISAGMEDILRAFDRQKRAIDPPPGLIPVVIGPASGAVVIHEACGHLLEASSLEGNSTPFQGRMGTRISPYPLTIVDDPSVEPFWGMRKIDDEGMPCQRVELVKDGYVQAFLNDKRLQRVNAMRLTASARREGFRMHPSPRMSCTYLEPGLSEWDEMLSGIRLGLYVDTIAGGTVLSGSGLFNFSVDGAFMIRNGHICEPVRGGIIKGNALDFLNGISMVGRDLQFAPLLCGGSSGTIRVSVGQPTIKVESLFVGK